MGKKLKNTAIYWLIRAAIWFVRLFPYEAASRFGGLLGRFAFHLIRGDRRRAERQLVERLGLEPAEARQTARRLFEHLGQSAAEALCAHKIVDRLDQYVEISPEFRALADERLNKGESLVVVTGHIGNWELMALALAHAGIPVNTIASASYDPRLTELIDSFRRSHQVRALLRGDPELTAKIASIIGSGGFIGFLIDQDTRVRGDFVPFFDKPAFTPTGAAFVADRFGLDVVVGGIERISRFRHRIHFVPLDCPTDDHTAATAAMTRHLEVMVRRYPWQWVWMHNRWKTKRVSAAASVPPDDLGEVAGPA
ncbi:MAG: lipid A biosynthesis acyltransferase [Myxococcales bacterium]|nr:lipid A biosynthesis acyltransferase [Myxococcales bacterium]